MVSFGGCELSAGDSFAGWIEERGETYAGDLAHQSCQSSEHIHLLCRQVVTGRGRGNLGRHLVMLIGGLRPVSFARNKQHQGYLTGLDCVGCAFSFGNQDFLKKNLMFCLWTVLSLWLCVEIFVVVEKKSCGQGNEAGFCTPAGSLQ